MRHHLRLSNFLPFLVNRPGANSQSLPTGGEFFAATEAQRKALVPDLAMPWRCASLTLKPRWRNQGQLLGLTSAAGFSYAKRPCDTSRLCEEVARAHAMTAAFLEFSRSLSLASGLR